MLPLHDAPRPDDGLLPAALAVPPSGGDTATNPPPRGPAAEARATVAVRADDGPAVTATRSAASRPPLRRLRGVDVRYISLAGAGKNGRRILAKGEALGDRVVVEKAIPIRKADGAKRMVYGVVYAPESVDADGHVMDAVEIEKALHGFMRAGRVGQVDTNHDEQTGVGYVAECWLTKAVGEGSSRAVCDALFPDEPEGTWCVGIKVTDDGAWSSVEAGELTGLSLAGVGQEEAVEAPAPRASVAAGTSSADASAEPLARAFVRKARALLGLGSSSEGAAEAAAAVAAEAEASPAQSVAKGFREQLLRTQLWQLTEALTSAVREVLDDDGVPDKAAAVRAVVAEFEAWLSGQVRGAMAKGVGAPAASSSGAAGVPPSPDAALASEVRGLVKAVESLVEEREALVRRLEAVEGQRLGRRSQPDDVGVAAEPPASPKGLRIVG
ncbi:MAG: XkdF-like putative serine protease domain-containing protein [Rubricoccaceae bacterium]|nr:XkdF-like putative serine protease domain-containing protein [Rubricoccaceae bacterium]